VTLNPWQPLAFTLHGTTACQGQHSRPNVARLTETTDAGILAAAGAPPIHIRTGAASPGCLPRTQPIWVFGRCRPASEAHSTGCAVAPRLPSGWAS